MHHLEKSLRNQLERTVQNGREISENAARAALEQLGVSQSVPFSYLTEPERNLRRRLRAHGRQLGDIRNPDTGTQETERLVEEAAYQHWHRMLFARFLAENALLMYPDPVDPVPVTLEECEDLAAEEGVANGWELAARYAARMLPQIFRLDSPVLALTLPPEHQQNLEKQVADLPEEVFTAADSLGWVYQFWQARRKEEVNASEIKIGERELPAVTQLFTEPYMVAFLLDNSLGAWWVAHMSGLHDGIERKSGARKTLQTSASETELRDFFSIPGVPLTYLRFVRETPPGEETETWVPASGIFTDWPRDLAKLKALDPCCGSGHFLVAILLMLVPMRRELEGLSAKDAVDAVLAENMHGLEIDRRCVEIAAFALALTAWTYPDACGYRRLPELNVACSGLSVGGTRLEWEKLANGDSKLRTALVGLYNEFKHAPVLGSLIDPLRSPVAKLVQWDGLADAVGKALNENRADEIYEAGVTARGLAKASQIMAGQYHWVVTNVPYLGQGKQSEPLRAFCEKHYNEAKNDLATVFLDRCLELCAKGGTSSIVLPQNWLFLTSYKKFREKLLKKNTWHLIARLGAQAFQTPMWDFNVQLLTLSRGSAAGQHEGLFEKSDSDNRICGVDVSEPRTAAEKAEQLLSSEIKSVAQAKQLENPDARITFEERSNVPLLAKYADSYWGLGSGDGLRFCRKHFELPIVDSDWEFLNITFTGTKPYTGRQEIVYWQNGCGELFKMAEAAKKKLKNIWQRGKEAWGKNGVAVSQMGSLPRCLYGGNIFQNGVAAIIPKQEKLLKPIFTFCSSDLYVEEVRRIDQKLAVTNLTLVKVPFDLEYWTKIAEKKYPHGLPQPYSDDPTQWIFHGHPCGSVTWDEEAKWTVHGPLRTDHTVLHVAVARLLGYRWPAELDPDMELAEQQREWVNKTESLLSYADEHGIVCIPPVRWEAAAADRLLNLLAAAYGGAWTNDTLARLLANADHAGKTLETWLRDKFFIQHCKLFHHRPFIWQIWDGLPDGFSALVNYHRLDYKALETLTYTYLGNWMRRQKEDVKNDIDGAAEKLAAAENLQKKLELILEGEAPYDIFVRWKPIEQQPIGYHPDLNDGVRLNIRPFMTVDDVKKKGAGILRDKPNIKWNKDRGKDVESAPWYHLGPRYGGNEGDRINDHHLTLEEKRSARNSKK